MKDFFQKVGDFFARIFVFCIDWLNFVQDKAFVFLNDTLKIPRPSALVEDIVFYGVLAVLVAVFVLILVLIFKPKKRKYTFFIDGDKIVKKFKKKEDIPYPEVALADDEIMAGWFSDAGYNNLFDLHKAKKRKLKLYAKIVKADSMLTSNPALSEPASAESVAGETLDRSAIGGEAQAFTSGAAQKFCPVCGAAIGLDAAFCVQCGAKIGYRDTEEENVGSDNGAVQEAPSAEKTNIVEEQLEITRTVMGIGEIYDEIRFELLSYERAKAFNKLGSARKKFIAEMFEKEEVVYLYLAVDPDVMTEKGYRVEKHNDPEFKVVPTKKVITGAKDYQEVMALIKETMAFNNLVKSDVNMATKTVSDEISRKNGFAFFVKNDVVATAAQDYYKLLRANVLSYSVDKSKPFNEENSGKMILKIFKKGEKIFVYLTLDAAKENLEFVGYDKNFADTPAMFEVATLDDLNRAYALIDKVMFRFGMEKHPENAELSLDETLKENCGFGYRIRN